MISIYSTGTKLVIAVDIPADINKGNKQVYETVHDLGGSEIAVAALAGRLRSDLEKRLKRIREDAYNQGAKDRAKKATLFEDDLGISTHNGGCHK